MPVVGLASLFGQFDYDRTKPFGLECETLSSRTEAEIKGCGFPGPTGGKVNLVLVTPKVAKPPFAGVVFQHGGGQSMTNYISEALILAQVGVVSMIPDASISIRSSGRNSDDTHTSVEHGKSPEKNSFRAFQNCG